MASACRASMLGVAAICFLVSPAIAAEKHWLEAKMVSDADLIVVGRLEPRIRILGLTECTPAEQSPFCKSSTGMRRAAASRFGSWYRALGQDPCTATYGSGFRTREPIQTTSRMPAYGFSNEQAAGVWQPSAAYGFDALSRRGDYEKLIRQLKH